MKIAHQRHVDAHTVELLAKGDDLARRLGRIDGNPNHFRSGLRQRLDLYRRRNWIGSVSIGHRLHHDRRVATDPYDSTAPTDFDLTRYPTRKRSDRHGTALEAVRF
jgi:hypothetical protein